MVKWKDGDPAVLMYQSKNRPYRGIALINVHAKEDAYSTGYPKLSAQTTEDIYGGAYRDYRIQISSNDVYTYRQAVDALFTFGVK